MTNPFGTGLANGAWIALAMFAAVSVAEAASGRMSFSGAVVEPTCSIADGHLAAAIAADAAGGQLPRRLVCGQTATDPGRSYSRVVVSLDAAAAANDRLLDYMVRRAEPATADGTPPKLIVRTYD